MPFQPPALLQSLVQPTPSQSAQGYINRIRPVNADVAGMGLQLQQAADGLGSSVSTIKTFVVGVYQALVAYLNQKQFTIPSGAATILPDLSLDQSQLLVLTTATTIKPPVNAISGSLFNLILVQDATGGRVVTFDASYIGLAGLSLTTTANTYSSLQFIMRDSDLRPVLLTTPLTGKTWP